MRRVGLIAFAFLALAAVVGFVATGGLTAGGSNASSAAMASGAPAPAVVEGGAAVGAPVPATAPNDSSGGAGSIAGGGALGSIGGVPAIGPAVVQTASVDVQVPKGEFDTAFEAAMRVAGKYGGYVESSSTSGTRVHSGTITIRVPNASFGRAMDDLDALGDVQSRSISADDVTNQYVDLNARLRTWEAQEAVLLRLMKRATSVEGTLRVQSSLQDVQFRIEEIKGQLRVLQNQVELASIDVALHEPGVVVHPVHKVATGERPSLAEAWTRAVNGFLGVVYATVVGLGYLVPITLIGLAVWFAVRRVRPATS